MARNAPDSLILQVFREPVLAGCAADYRSVEDEIARNCAELGCPHPHLALESLSDPHEVWWFNAYASEAEKERVEKAYADNQPLIAALEQLSARKRRFTGEGSNRYLRHRTGSPEWTPAGARYVVSAVVQDPAQGEAPIFDAPDGGQWLIKAATSLEQAESVARIWGAAARVFAVRPYWGFPADEWLEADPEFWKINPLAQCR
jgi:hypothetical protein